MASGLFLRVLLLSLINIGQLTLGDVYRLRSYSEQAEPSPRSYNPPLLRYDDLVQQRAFAAGSKFPEGFKPFEPTKGGQVDGYSQRGSVPSYRPASHAVKGSPSGFYPREPVWHPELPKGGRTGSNIVSSGAILMHAPEKSPQQQQLGSPNSGVFQSKTEKWEGTSLEMPSKGMHSAAQPPQRHPVPGPRVQGKEPGPRVQGKEGMWDRVFASSGQSPGMYPAYKPLQMPIAPQPPSPKKKAEWKTVPSSNSQSPGMYSMTSPPYKHPAVSPLLQSNPGMWDRRYAPNTRSQEKQYGGRLPLTHPAFSTPAVLQSKEGMWGSVFAETGKSLEPVKHDGPRSSRPAAVKNYPRGQQLRGVVEQLPPAAKSFQGRAGVLDDVGSSAAAKQTLRLSRPVLGSHFGYEGRQPQPASARRNRQA
ncbi:uncharacterized protein [Nothobranchius furzeri]|uniref:uncharacterized protein n=1 Tax=Nothobranchius furzeri TaxID=105023 RepID=UPI00077CFFB4